MFVDIENFKSSLAVENILTPYKKGRLSFDKKSRLPKEPITSDVCMQILKSTNYPRNIKDMLLCIAELPSSEQPQFKDVVSACFEQREQPNDILVLGKKLAHASGYDTMLADVLKPKDGVFLLSDAKGARGYRNVYLNLSDEEIKNIECYECTGSEFQAVNRKVLPRRMSFPMVESVYFTDCNFEGVNALSFHSDAIVFMDNTAHLPEKLDVSTCQYFVVKPDMLPMVENWTFSENGLGIDMRRMKPSADLDLSRFGYVNLMQSDLKDVSGVRFRDGAVVILRDAKNLPQNIDFSKCVKINLSGCDLSGQQELSLRDGAEVNLDTAQNLPFNIDFSRCVKVDLSGCDLKGQAQLCFDEAKSVYLEQVELGQKILNFPKCKDLNLQGTSLLPRTKLYFPMAEIVNFSQVTNLPKDIDVSHCAKVNLRGCDLKNQPNLRFADGAEVTLHTMDYLPHNLDFSSCAVLDLFDCNLQNQPNLRFADGAAVRLIEAYNTPKVLDFSPCRRVRLVNCKLDNTLAVIFKNQEQYENSDMGLFVKEDMKIFFADKMSDDDWKEIENLKTQQNNGLKKVWRNMKILWNDRR